MKGGKGNDMFYLAALILLFGIWWLSVLELKKDQPQPNNLFFYKVISISFTVMLVFLLIGGTHNFFDFLMFIIIGGVSVVITALIALPKEKLPTWYIEKLNELDQFLKKDDSKESDRKG